jgi:Phospholipase_D-nuclease N-terminal
MPYGILGLLNLILVIYCIYLIVNTSLDPSMKLVWILVVLFIPLLGPILYLVVGRGNRAT